MNAVEVLKQDHKEIRKLFDQYEKVGEQEHQKKQVIADKLIEELTAHAQREEQTLFPAMRAKGDKKAKEMVLSGTEEHRVAEFMMERLNKTEPEDETFDAKFKVLMEDAKHHFEEEERELFPKAEKLLDNELDSLGVQMAAREHLPGG